MSESEKMEIVLNGERYLIEANSSIEELLQELAQKRGGSSQGRTAVAVEINAEIVPRNHFAQTLLQPNDAVEVVTLVGGG